MTGRLVGRERDLLRVGPLFSDLAAGRGGLVRITGEPGIGKTRFAEELLVRLRGHEAASVLHCLPVGRSESPSAATGTVMRPDTLRGYASEAGFTDIETLPIEHDLFQFYRLVAS